MAFDQENELDRKGTTERRSTSPPLVNRSRERGRSGHSIRDVLTCAYYLQEGIYKRTFLFFASPKFECFYAVKRNRIPFVTQFKNGVTEDLLPLWDGGARTLYYLITTFVASRSATPSAYGRNPKARTRFIARKGKPMRPYLIYLLALDHSGGLNLCFRMNPSLGMTPDLNLWGLLTPVKSSNLAH